MKDQKEPDKITIMVIGVDNLQHVAEPHKDVCLCGMKILRKKYRRDDWKLFSCYECTF
jgi:hypothetical protein